MPDGSLSPRQVPQLEGFYENLKRFRECLDVVSARLSTGVDRLSERPRDERIDKGEYKPCDMLTKLNTEGKLLDEILASLQITATRLEEIV